ncbi:hypothetical protein FB451DRAFT_1259653 [Mycena latifolia]|nr:hypothetical protein FB451DRAFT_1259653 [Mycena latifolia]
MHPALGLDNLFRLPTYVQAFATPAADGSLADLYKLFALLAEERSLRQQYMLCLPVFYANLDLAQIPGDGLNELHSSAAAEARARALISLKSLRVLDTYPPDAGVDLWPRIWGWLSYFHRHAHVGLTEIEICNDLLAFILRVRVLVTRAWKLVLQQGEETNQNSLSDLFWIFHFFLQIRVFVNWEEAVEGAGGTEADLVTLIARFIDFFIPTSRTILTPRILQYMDAVFCPLMDLGQKELVLKAFVAGGLVISLTNVICVFSAASNFPQTEDIMGAALLLLSAVFKLPGQHLVIRDAVVAGFLRAMVSCIRGIDVDLTTKLLTGILPLSTVFYTERIALAKVWNSEQCVSRKACDNMECGAIRQKSDFKCCGYCHQVYYCSRRCQRIDWKSGNHRAGCKHPEYLSPRNISFMRALLHHDYEANKEEILRLQITFIRQNPSLPIVTIFDYASGRARISIETICVASSMMQNYRGVNCAELVPRAERSGGRMQLHLTSVPIGRRLQARIFPMRSNVPTLHQAVRRLAAEEESPHLSVQLRRLIHGTTGVVLVETH